MIDTMAAALDSHWVHTLHILPLPDLSDDQQESGKRDIVTMAALAVSKHSIACIQLDGMSFAVDDNSSLCWLYRAGCTSGRLS